MIIRSLFRLHLCNSIACQVRIYLITPLQFLVTNKVKFKIFSVTKLYCSIILLSNIVINIYPDTITILYNSGKKRKLTQMTSSNVSRVSWDATSSLDILMDDTSPPSSVTSSNYITGSNGEIDSNEEKNIVENALVSSTTKCSLAPSLNAMDIKKEPGYANSTESLSDDIRRNNYSRQSSSNQSFDEEESLEEFDDDESKTHCIHNEENKASSLKVDIKPDRIYLAKDINSTSTSSRNKNIVLGGKGVSSVAPEATNFSAITCSKPGLNGIEFSMGSPARTILKLPNPLSTTSNGTLILHQATRSNNGNPIGKPNVIPPIAVKPNVGAMHLKRSTDGSTGNKSIICHSKANSSSNPQWLSSCNSNIKIRSPMTVVNTSLSKIPLNKKRIIPEESPKHFEIRPAVTDSNGVISENRISSNRNSFPSLCNKSTFNAGETLLIYD